MTKDQLDKELQTAWLYCSDAVTPFWRKIFFSNKRNFNYFKKKMYKWYEYSCIN